MSIRSRLRRLENNSSLECPGCTDAMAELLARIFELQEASRGTLEEPIFCQYCGREVKKISIEYIDRIMAGADDEGGGGVR